MKKHRTTIVALVVTIWIITEIIINIKQIIL